MESPCNSRYEPFARAKNVVPGLPFVSIVNRRRHPRVAKHGQWQLTDCGKMLEAHAQRLSGQVGWHPIVATSKLRRGPTGAASCWPDKAIVGGIDM